MMKKVGSCYYVHKSNIQELLDILPNDWYKKEIVKWYDFRKQKGTSPYEVIKYDVKKHMLSFIDSPDWNTANEPCIGSSTCWNFDKGTQTHKSGRKDNPQIYHNKWMFVADDYDGFDVGLAKKRTEIWNSITGIEKKKKFIGNRDYWKLLLETHGMSL